MTMTEGSKMGKVLAAKHAELFHDHCGQDLRASCVSAHQLHTLHTVSFNSATSKISQSYCSDFKSSLLLLCAEEIR